LRPKKAAEKSANTKHAKPGKEKEKEPRENGIRENHTSIYEKTNTTI